MSEELYYRGNSTYEVAVENRLRSIEYVNNRKNVYCRKKDQKILRAISILLSVFFLFCSCNHDLDVSEQPTQSDSTNTQDNTSSKEENLSYKTNVLSYENNKVNYHLNEPVTTYLGNTDIIKGDKITYTIMGFAEEDISWLKLEILSTSFLDGMDFCLSESNEEYLAQNIKKGEKFNFTKTLDIVNTAKTRNLSDIKLNIIQGLAKGESEAEGNHKDSVKLCANITMQLDKTARVSPVTVVYNANGGEIDSTSEKLYPGQKFTDAKKDKMFLEKWVNFDSEEITVAPEYDVSVKAIWTDRLNLIPYCEYGQADHGPNGKLVINQEWLKKYPNAVLTLDVTHSAITENWDWAALVACGWEDNVYWTVENECCTNVIKNFIYKICLKDFFAKYPNVNEIQLFNMGDPEWTINDFSLDYAISKITYNLDGGIMDVVQEELFAGLELTRTPLKQGMMFNGWYDLNNKKHTTVPSKDCILYAKWSDTLDITSYLDDGHNITMDMLKNYELSYPGAVIGFTCSNTFVNQNIGIGVILYDENWNAYKLLLWADLYEGATESYKWYTSELISYMEKNNFKYISLPISNDGLNLDKSFVSYDSSKVNILIDYELNCPEDFPDILRSLNIKQGAKFYFESHGIDDQWKYCLIDEDLDGVFELSLGGYDYPDYNEYIFDGWYLDSQLTMPCCYSPESAQIASKDLVLHAKWNEYRKLKCDDTSVDFNQEVLGGSDIGYIKMPFNEKIWLMDDGYNGFYVMSSSFNWKESYLGHLNNAENKTNFNLIFGGWFQDADCTIPVPTSEEDGILVEEDILIYPKWIEE